MMRMPAGVFGSMSGGESVAVARARGTSSIMGQPPRDPAHRGGTLATGALPGGALQVPERLQPADDLALLLLGVRAVLAAGQEVQHLERAERLLHTRAGRWLGHGDLDLGVLGRLVVRAAGLVRRPHVDLDHAGELRAHTLACCAGRHRQRAHRGHAVPGEQPRGEGDASLDPLARERVDAGRAPVEDLYCQVPRDEPSRELLGDRVRSPQVGARHPDRKGRPAHDAPAATRGKRPGRKMTFLSFTTSWSFRESCTAWERTFASSARPRAFTSSSASSPTRMWNTSCKMTGPASSCSVTKCAVHPETRTPSSQACL